MKKPIAEKVELVTQLLGGQPVIDENGDILLDADGKPKLTYSFITKEEALALLDEDNQA